MTSTDGPSTHAMPTACAFLVLLALGLVLGLALLTAATEEGFIDGIDKDHLPCLGGEGGVGVVSANDRAVQRGLVWFGVHGRVALTKTTPVPNSQISVL